MSTITCKAKLGSDWGMNELSAFNIEIIHEEPEQFFGCSLPRDLNFIPSMILDNVHKPQDATGAEAKFFAYLENAIHCVPLDKESFVIDFVVVLLGLMGYDQHHRVIHTRPEIPFEMCGEHVIAKADVCITEQIGQAYILLVQVDKVSNLQLFKFLMHCHSCNL